MKLGIYQHYKGNFYRVIGIAKHSETLEDMVVYETMYDNPKGRIWVRPRFMFEETIRVQGQKKKRFTFIK